MRLRVRLRWPVSILQGQSRARVLSTVTENVSSRGFCCVVDEPLALGESLACILGFQPRHDSHLNRGLRCEVQVVWVRVTGDGRFGIGCRIDDYTIMA